ncbi:oligosaccharide flippase family protein [Methylobacterium sp. J-030]|uniref:oligosaccharide flippase family protein n=1 Tax=Methylobacterium sp. J-030 TaxID=2836627 RepID=UPI001FBAA5BF|nr:oligosaccharide flippase family protein [Methylobacterium sp. J-030]MCJ2068458.1 oligosaccharide flippase family protein [Methylobacterium sp. J-030]
MMSLRQSNPSAGEEQNVQQAAAKGASWLLAARFAAKSIDAVVLFILARVLEAADFGLVALAMGFILVAEAMLELPVGLAILRLKMIDPAHFDTAFTLSILRSIVFLIISYVLAYPISLLSSDSRIINLILILSIAPIVRGLASPYMIVFVKNLDFSREFAAEICGKIFGAFMSLYVAYTFRSYWAIAAGTVTTPLVGTILSYIMAPYRPRLTLEKWRAFSHFIGWGAITQLFVAISWQCDRFFLGHFVTKADLGQYALSSDLANFPNQSVIVPIMRPLNTVIYGRTDDLDGLRRAYLQAVSTICTLGIPAYVGLFITSDQVARLFLGPEWGRVGYILGVIALSFLPGLFTLPWPSVTVALERPKLITIATSIEFFVKLPVTWFTVKNYGVEGAIWARVCMNVFIALIAFVFLKRLINLSYRQQLEAAIRPIIASAVMTIMILPLLFYMLTLDTGIKFALCLASVIALGGASYTLVLMMLWYFSGSPPGAEHLVERLYKKLRFKVFRTVEA